MQQADCPAAFKNTLLRKDEATNSSNGGSLCLPTTHRPDLEHSRPVVKNVPGASPGVWPMTNLWQVVEPGPLQA